MQRCRHPDLDAYIGDAVSALRRPIAAGDVKRVVLAIKDDDAAASDGPLERFTFDFLLRDDDDTAGVNDTAGGGVADVNGGSAVRGPSRADVDQCSRAFAACLSKIAFSDALLTPLPQAAMNAGRLSFEIVAYSTRAGVAAQLCSGGGGGGGGGEGTEERVGSGTSDAPGDASRDGGTGPAGDGRSVGDVEPRLEFRAGTAKEVVPVKSAVTPIVNLDVFVERRRSSVG